MNSTLTTRDDHRTFTAHTTSKARRVMSRGGQCDVCVCAEATHRVAVHIVLVSGAKAITDLNMCQPCATAEEWLDPA